MAEATEKLARLKEQDPEAYQKLVRDIDDRLGNIDAHGIQIGDVVRCEMRSGDYVTGVVIRQSSDRVTMLIPQYCETVTRKPDGVTRLGVSVTGIEDMLRLMNAACQKYAQK